MLCNPADIRAYLGLTEQQAPDSVLLPLCAAADAFVLSYLNRTSLDVASYTETYHGTGSNTLAPDNRPLVSVTSVAVDGKAVPAAAGQGAGFVSDDLAIYLRDYRFNRGVMNVQITYSAGFATVPEGVKRAAIDIVAEKYARRNRVGISSKTIGQESISYSRDDVTPFAYKALSDYILRFKTSR